MEALIYSLGVDKENGRIPAESRGKVLRNCMSEVLDLATGLLADSHRLELHLKIKRGTSLIETIVKDTDSIVEILATHVHSVESKDAVLDIVLNPKPVKRKHLEQFRPTESKEAIIALHDWYHHVTGEEE